MWVYWRASRCLGEFAASSVPIFEQQPAYWAGPLPASLYNMKMLKEMVLAKKRIIWTTDPCNWSAAAPH
jgi:hypothetical protein